MRERVIELPQGQAALLCEPDVAGSDVAVVLFNAGGLHRSGPFRLYVALARTLAAAGVPCLRFDQPGVGDALGPAERPLPELMRVNLDALAAASGCRRFVVGGICSAADLGWRLALTDPRVVGLLLLDPLARREAAGFRLGQLRMLLARGPGGWWELARRRLQRQDPPAQAQVDAELRDWPAPGEEAIQLRHLLDRDLRLFMLYTGGAARYMTSLRQVRRGFGAGVEDRRVWLQHWHDCDHLFYRPQHRERLIAAVRHWLQQQFGSAA